MTTTATDRNETWNYRTLIGEGTMLNICYNLTSPRLVLPYLYMAVGAPIIFAGLIVPLVQLSSLISQLVTASAFSSGLRRKWALSVSEVGLASGLAVLGIAERKQRFPQSGDGLLGLLTLGDDAAFLAAEAVEVERVDAHRVGARARPIHVLEQLIVARFARIGEGQEAGPQ